MGKVGKCPVCNSEMIKMRQGGWGGAERKWCPKCMAYRDKYGNKSIHLGEWN